MNLLTPAIVKGLGIALAVSLLGNIGLGLYAWGLRAEARLASERLADAPAVNAEQTTALHNTIDALRTCVGQDAFVQKQWQAAQAANAEAASALAKARALNNQRRSNTYATDKTCHDWAAMPVCRAVSDSL